MKEYLLVSRFTGFLHCRYLRNNIRSPPMSHSKNLTYNTYLRIDELLELQSIESAKTEQVAHDEMLFVVIHQAYELWFKQILHDIESVRQLFEQATVPETQLLLVNSRLERCRLILDLLIDQIRVLETMTPLDFLDFRNLLGHASGFQSLQFRILEHSLGLPPEKRINYGSTTYRDALSPAEQERFDAATAGKLPLLRGMEQWLERTPFLQQDGFDFVAQYRQTLETAFHQSIEKVKADPTLSAEQRSERQKQTEANRDTVLGMLDKPTYDGHTYSKSKQQPARGYLLSWQALMAGLFIHVYRDMPILHQPYRLLSLLVEIDDRLSTWRFRHAQMVLKMLGSKPGTGGSAGYDYLMQTVEAHSVFRDFALIATLLVPRTQVPPLPKNLQEGMASFFQKS